MKIYKKADVNEEERYSKVITGDFDNFFHARNWARKHISQECNIPYKGVKV